MQQEGSLRLIESKYRSLAPMMDERVRRQWAATAGSNVRHTPALDQHASTTSGHPSARATTHPGLPETSRARHVAGSCSVPAIRASSHPWANASAFVEHPGIELGHRHLRRATRMQRHQSGKPLDLERAALQAGSAAPDIQPRAPFPAERLDSGATYCRSSKKYTSASLRGLSG